MKKHILLVEDEPGLRLTLQDCLEEAGYTIEAATGGNEALKLEAGSPFDLILLDLMLPDISGFDVCRILRQSGCLAPILILTARTGLADKIVGLKLGADDYVTKPFEVPELLVRIEALLRRAALPAPQGREVQRFGAVEVDLRRARVLRDGKPLSLSGRELQLLFYLVKHPGETLSRQQLLADVWGYRGAAQTRTVDVHVGSLRQKLEADPKIPEMILTVHGKGYLFAG